MNKNQVREQLATGKMNRRQFNKALMALGATTVMMPMSSRMALGASGDHPTVFTWEGWEVPEFHGAYIEKHGESPNFAIFADEEEAFAKMRAGFNVDITQPCTYKIPMWHDAGLSQSIPVGLATGQTSRLVLKLSREPFLMMSSTSFRLIGAKPLCSTDQIWHLNTSTTRPGASYGIRSTRVACQCQIA